MNLRQRCQAVFEAGYQLGQTSFRALAKQMKLSKSSVHRLHHRLLKRNQHPESPLWETEAGQQWLRLLVVATIFVFALQGGMGCERLSQFFHLLRLDPHIGVSPTALRSLRARIEATILDYQHSAHQTIQQISSGVEVCAAADETFFDQVVLVMLDLPSGYIFVEEVTENCQYETWQQRVAQAFESLGLKVKYLVSDRAKAIIKLALNDLGAKSVSDLFHVLSDLNRSVGFELNSLGSRLQKQINRAVLHQADPELISALEAQQQQLQESLVSYDHCCHRLSLGLHPFEIYRNRPSSTESVSVELSKILTTLQSLSTTHRLQDRRSGVRKLKNQIPTLSEVIDLWWDWVSQALAHHEVEVHLVDWVKEYLLPVVYWKQQVQRTKTPYLRKEYHTAHLRALVSLEQHPVTMSLSQSEKDQWWHWARWMVSKFQRSSSAVEGRNGYLSGVHHNRRGLSPQRLKVSTVIHNFFLKRDDGTTAAQRLFGQPFPDLFEYLVENMGELPQPRKSRKRSKPETLTLPTVPS